MEENNKITHVAFSNLIFISRILQKKISNFLAGSSTKISDCVVVSISRTEMPLAPRKNDYLVHPSGPLVPANGDQN
jgi:hypothetical protein